MPSLGTNWRTLWNRQQVSASHWGEPEQRIKSKHWIKTCNASIIRNGAGEQFEKQHPATWHTFKDLSEQPAMSQTRFFINATMSSSNLSMPNLARSGCKGGKDNICSQAAKTLNVTSVKSWLFLDSIWAFSLLRMLSCQVFLNIWPVDPS